MENAVKLQSFSTFRISDVQATLTIIQLHATCDLNIKISKAAQSKYPVPPGHNFELPIHQLVSWKGSSYKHQLLLSNISPTVTTAFLYFQFIISLKLSNVLSFFHPIFQSQLYRDTSRINSEARFDFMGTKTYFWFSLHPSSSPLSAVEKNRSCIW